MNHYRFILSYAVLLMALLVVNPAMQAAKNKTKAHSAPKEHAAKTALATQHDDFQKQVEQQIASLKDDVYTRATWKKLQEVKQESDDTASNLRLLAFGAGAVGFVLGCVLTGFIAKRMGRPDESLKIT
jgi:septal ring factor EnvC (AmiA/AmiB activator)